jgi:hypothetical protein
MGIRKEKVEDYSDECILLSNLNNEVYRLSMMELIVSEYDGMLIAQSTVTFR